MDQPTPTSTRITAGPLKGDPSLRPRHERDRQDLAAEDASLLALSRRTAATRGCGQDVPPATPGLARAERPTGPKVPCCLVVVLGYRSSVIVRCQNCGVSVEIWREPVAQIDRDADNVGPAVHVITGGGWVLHTCRLTGERSRGADVVRDRASRPPS
jgi:hypothetical protein